MILLMYSVISHVSYNPITVSNHVELSLLSCDTEATFAVISVSSVVASCCLCVETHCSIWYYMTFPAHVQNQNTARNLT